MKHNWLSKRLVGAALTLAVAIGGAGSMARAGDPFAPQEGKSGARRTNVDPFAPRGGKAAGGMVAVVVPQKDVVTVEQAKAIFRWMASQEDLPFRYTPDGCYARAHLMIKRMHAMGLKPGKIWAMSTSGKADMFAETPYGTKTLNGLTGQFWAWHCAPTLKVRLPDGQIGTCVIDPALFSRVAMLETWKKALQPASGTVLYFTETRFGEAPQGPSGSSKGIGYMVWEEKPIGDVDLHAVKVCEEYKKKEPAVR